MTRGHLLVALALLALSMGAVVAGAAQLALAFAVLAGVVAIAAVATLRARPSAKALPPVAVPPEEVELEEGPVSCCLKCGSIDMRQPRLNEGLIPGIGESLTWICGRCKWKGQPLEFDDVTSYREFVKGLQPSPPPP